MQCLQIFKEKFCHCNRVFLSRLLSDKRSCRVESQWQTDNQQEIMRQFPMIF